MGNQFCYDPLLHQMPNEKTQSLRQRRIGEAKSEFIRVSQLPLNQFKAMKQDDITEKFYQFHQSKLHNVIRVYQFPKAGKDFISNNYDSTAFGSSHIIVLSGKKSVEAGFQKTLSREIKQHIEELEDRSLFYKLIQEYQNFFRDTVLSAGCFNKSTCSSPDTSKKSAIDYDGLNRSVIMRALNSEPNLSKCSVISLVNLFSLLKSILIHMYKNDFESIPKTIDLYIAREMLLQKIIQHFIYNKRALLGYLLELCINHYYANHHHGLNGDTVHIDKHLDVSLLPEPGQQTQIQDIDTDSWLLENPPCTKENDLRSSSRMSFLATQNKIQQAISEVEKENVPYKELFVILQEIIEEKRPFRIYYQVGRLNESVIDVYMKHRPDDQLQMYRELILTEDNRLQIFLFLLHKFQLHSGCDLRKHMYNKMRFMMDFDQVLDKRIKYELDQSFVRFYACLEMIVDTS